MSLVPHTVFENDPDKRKVKCSCGNPQCRIGLNFDASSSGNGIELIMFLTDKFGNDHAMYLDKKEIKQIINELKTYL